MIIVIIAVILGIASLVWLWRVPVRNLVKAMKAEGSSTFEAYAVVFLLMAGLALTIYLIAGIL